MGLLSLEYDMFKVIASWAAWITASLLIGASFTWFMYVMLSRFVG